MIFKRICFLLVLTFIAGIVTAQVAGDRELTVEESFLQQSVELMIIREQSRAESREMKLVALEFIVDAINRGNRSDDIRVALEHLGSEGIINPVRENGRIINSHPDIRLRAATYLGVLGTSEAVNTLIKMCMAENDPLVLTEIIKSLGDIGINENEQTIIAITGVMNHFDTLNPNNVLAVSVLEAYEKIARTDGGIRDARTIRTIMSIAEGPYIRPVQQRARQLLSDLRALN